MTTIDKVKVKLQENSYTGANTHLIPSKNMRNWYKDELVFVREIVDNKVMVFRSMDGQLYFLANDDLINFKLL